MIFRLFAPLALLSLTLSELSPRGVAAEKPADFAAANNAFAGDLYARLAAEKGNLFFSPASVSTALSMLATGARGATAGQFAATLHLPETGEVAPRSAGGLLRELNGGAGKSRAFQLTVANALWGQKGIDFQPAFLRVAKGSFGAALNEVDFAGNAERSRRTINDWVEKATRDRIADLIPQGGVSSETRLVLTNAIYFKGAWSVPFEKSATCDKPFQIEGAGRVSVPMMQRTGLFGYAKGDGFQSLEISYKGGELALIVLLPNSPGDLARVEKQLATGKIPRSFSSLTDREVEVWLPRFRIAAQCELSKPLAALGLTDAFTAKADFSGLAGSRDWRLSGVVHKAFVEVNEEGTEAAAATGLMELGLGPEPQAKPPVFRADHPFAFVIRHRKSGAILFAGRVADPRGAVN
jgi:serpin B